MQDRDSNIGQEGVESIRLKGKRIEDMPLGTNNQAKEQLGVSRETERMNKINGINGKFPKHRVDYLLSRITECRENIVRIQSSSAEQAQMISDYKGHIALCEHRDKEIAKLQEDVMLSNDEIEAGIKALKKQFLPYDVAAMEQQIVQCKEAVERCTGVIQQEQDSIAEFEGVLSLCRQRDKELSHYGAVAEGS